MDRRSWLWRRRSSEKSLGESESSTSSERYSDDQDALRASPNNNSPNHAQSPDISSKILDNEVHEANKQPNDVHETVKSLTEKLSAALLNISAKEALLKQHSKVAEEAVSGWEKAEKEAVILKHQLEAAFHKNSVLEDKISLLDGALKECVRQFRQSREEQEQKVHDALIKNTREWESEKIELKNELAMLKEQIEDAKVESFTTIIDDLQSKIEATEKEKAILKAVLVTLSEELNIRTLERELSRQTAETASKQHLESITKVKKLEAECRRLKTATPKTSSANDHKTHSRSVCMESLTDSQLDSGDRLLGMDNEPSCSDSWVSALIAELDQFKNENTGARNLVNSINIELMDDFLEMERIAALPEADSGGSIFGLEDDSNRLITSASPSKVEIEVLNQNKAELEAKFKTIESEKAKMEITLAETLNQLVTSRNQLIVAESKLSKLQKDLDMAKESKRAAISETVTALESQLDSTHLRTSRLQDKVASLEGKVAEGTFSSELKVKLEALEKTKEVLESQLHLSHLEVENLQEQTGLLEGRVEKERALCAEFAHKLEAVDSERETMTSQLLTADLEISKLQEKVGLLEQIIEEERSQSTEPAKLESVVAERKLLEVQLDSARSEMGKLKDNMSLLEGKINEERALSAEFAEKCQNLEEELSRKRREAEFQHVSSSNGDLKIKQEKGRSMSSGKLAECQKTIASLGRQLKSLATLDDFMLETEKLELNGYSTDLRDGDPDLPCSSYSSQVADSYNRPNGKEKGSPRSSAPSSTTQSGRRVAVRK